MADFTPGPWKLKPDLRGAPIVQTNEREIAKVLYHLGSEDREVGHNARLIAAAPEMYKAIKTAISYLNSFRDKWQEGEEWLYRDLKRAIAKAEGKEA